MRTAPTKLRVINLVPQHNVKANRQFTRYRHFRQSGAFAERQTAIRPLQSRIVTAGGLRGLDQKKAQQAIALFGQVPKALAPAAGILYRNQADVAGDVLGVGEAFNGTE